MAGAARIPCVIVALLALLALSPVAANASAAGGERVDKPRIEFDPIPYDSARKRQMAAYSDRHYGDREWRLENPRAIVLHYTAGSTYSSAWNTFASNAPSLGERPGVCAQFIVDKDGTIYQLTRLAVRCRHTIGLNHVAFGIEMVQEDLGGSHATSQAILDREEQARSAVRLAAWLRDRYGIGSRDLIGHAMANDSRLFEDRKGWRNDHTDWPKAETRTFRKRVNRVLGGRRSARAGRVRVPFGRSEEGRRLVARRLGDPSASRTALIVGEIHGDEEAGRGIVRRLRSRPGALRGVDAWTVASVNPDGHAADSRTNSNGVDLNRNFSVGWRSGEPTGSGYYPGTGPFSESESRSLRRLIRRVEPDLTIHYHQPWGAVLAPCRGAIPAQRLYSRISGLELDRCRGQDLPGTVTRWQNRRGGTAFVVELPERGLSDAGVRRHARAAARVAASR